MIVIEYHLEFITPCFCAGANQAEAEIRAASVRGHLRWWFRVLGGTREQESSVFGSVQTKPAMASVVQVRCRLTNRGKEWCPPRVDPSRHDAYVYYFASVSGKTRGQRWTGKGNLPPGSRFLLQLRCIRELAPDAKHLFDEALRCWLVLGGIGLRVTRGLGATACDEFPLTDQELQSIKQLLRSRGFEFLVYRRDLANWWNAVAEAGQVLKEELRSCCSAGRNGNNPTPLGSSNPRQTSAVYLRPARFADRPEKPYGLIVFEAPAERVLGKAKASRHGAPVTRRLMAG